MQDSCTCCDTANQMQRENQSCQGTQGAGLTGLGQPQLGLAAYSYRTVADFKIVNMLAVQMPMHKLISRNADRSMAGSMEPLAIHIGALTSALKAPDLP